jgi:putative transposase
MRLMGLEAIYRAPKTSVRHPEHPAYRYLLKGLAIERADHLWCADITYIPVQRGFLYLVAVMDWASRHVLAWRLSNTLDARFCIEALAEALDRDGRPEIFNTDQGSQFTSREFTRVLEDAGIAISIDGRGRCLDNVFIERLWRSLKYEAVYLHELADGSSTLIRCRASFDPASRGSPFSVFTGVAERPMIPSSHTKIAWQEG